MSEHNNSPDDATGWRGWIEPVIAAAAVVGTLIALRELSFWLSISVALCVVVAGLLALRRRV